MTNEFLNVFPLKYANGDKFWCYEGKFHRVDGPAVEDASGNKCWYYNGERVNCSSTEEFLRLLKLKVFW